MAKNKNQKNVNRELMEFLANSPTGHIFCDFAHIEYEFARGLVIQKEGLEDANGNAAYKFTEAGLEWCEKEGIEVVFTDDNDNTDSEFPLAPQDQVEPTFDPEPEPEPELAPEPEPELAPEPEVNTELDFDVPVKTRRKRDNKPLSHIFGPLSSPTIESGIEAPIESKTATRRKKYDNFPFELLEVGQSFLISCDVDNEKTETVRKMCNYKTFETRVKTGNKKVINGREVDEHVPTKKFVFRPVDGGIRIWRTM